MALMIKRLETLGEKNYIVETLNYLVVAAKDFDLEAAATFFNREISQDLGGEFMTLAERLRAEGEARGEAKGEARGKQKIAAALLRAGSSLAFVSRMTGLSQEQIKYLAVKETEAV